MELILILYATNILYWIPILAHFSNNFDFVPFITSRDTRPTAANPLHAAAAVDRWDGRTDRHSTVTYRVGQKTGPQTHDRNSANS